MSLVWKNHYGEKFIVRTCGHPSYGLTHYTVVFGTYPSGATLCGMLPGDWGAELDTEATGDNPLCSVCKEVLNGDIEPII